MNLVGLNGDGQFNLFPISVKVEVSGEGCVGSDPGGCWEDLILMSPSVL